MIADIYETATDWYWRQRLAPYRSAVEAERAADKAGAHAIRWHVTSDEGRQAVAALRALLAGRGQGREGT